MGNPQTLEELATRIEALVAGHIDEVRRRTQQAVERGLAAASSSTSKPVKSSAKPKRTYSSRRSPAELSELSESLCSLIHERPGESMLVFAAELGVSVRDLHRPMTMLKGASRIRSVGQRHRTRYFPAINDKPSRARG
jgi:hypothetical protein